jgi:hypothetical protein
MTDIIFSNSTEPMDGAGTGTGVPQPEPIWDLIELLFFAYRDFVSDPDHVLEKFGFGRAHHRVLHFVNRNPGLKVANLLETLRITKQSLGRVLRELSTRATSPRRKAQTTAVTASFLSPRRAKRWR